MKYTKMIEGNFYKVIFKYSPGTWYIKSGKVGVYHPVGMFIYNKPREDESYFTDASPIRFSDDFMDTDLCKITLASPEDTLWLQESITAGRLVPKPKNSSYEIY